MSETRCPNHIDMERRMHQSEQFMAGQVDENAKIWKAVNLIREEKATVAVTLEGVKAAVEELRGELRAGLAELRGEIMALKLVPAQRWNSVVAAILTGVITLVLGGLAGMMLK